jgi:hypothetical protein
MAAGNATVTQEPLEKKVFLERSGVLVSDAVFQTSTGASYPIRNISSVAVAYKPAHILVLLPAIVLTLFGLFVLAGSVTLGLVFLLLGVPFWYMLSDRPHQLQLGAGGIFQTAIESDDVSELNGIAGAINDSLLYIQRGA